MGTLSWSILGSVFAPWRRAPAPASWLVPGPTQQRTLALPDGHVQPRASAHSQRVQPAGWVHQERRVRNPLPPRAVPPRLAVAVPRRPRPIPLGTRRSPTSRPTLQRLPGSPHTACALLHTHQSGERLGGPMPVPHFFVERHAFLSERACCGKISLPKCCLP